MLSEKNYSHPHEPTRPSFGLTPWGVVAGLAQPYHDDRLIGAQGALNRVQVWLGDLFIDLAARRAQRRKAERAPGIERAPGEGRAA